ncbi:MAG: hypothetical protein ACR2N3_15520 [Pyrinomonadaceae bacterium]
MLHGETIYKDFIEITFPGTELWYEFLLSVAGPRIELINLTILLLGFSLTYICLKISEQLFDNVYKYLPPSLFLFFGFYWFGFDASHRLFSLLWAMVALYVLLKNQSRLTIFIVGALCGFSSFFTQTRGIAAVLAFALFLVWQAAQNKNWKNCFIQINILSLAFIATVFILISYFWFSGGTEDFFYNTVFFISRYRAHPVNNYSGFFNDIKTISDESLVVVFLKLFYMITVPLSFLFFLIWYKLKKNSLNSQTRTKLMMIALFGASLLLTNTSPNLLRIYQVSMPALFLIVWMLADVKILNKFIAKIVLAILIIFALFLITKVQRDPRLISAELPTGKVVFTPGMNPERYLWLAQNTKPNDYFFESYTRTYFPLLLQNSTKLPLLTDTGYTSPEQVISVVQDLKEKPPKYIFWDGNWDKPPSLRNQGDNLTPIYDFLQANYCLERNFTAYGGSDFQIWERCRNE